MISCFTSQFLFYWYNFIQHYSSDLPTFQFGELKSHQSLRNIFYDRCLNVFYTCQRKKWAVMSAMYYLHLLLGCSLLLCSTAAFEKQHRRGEHWEFLVPSPWQVYEVWRWSKVSLWGIRETWARTGEAAPFIEGCCASLLWYATLARGKQIKK